MEYCKSKVSIIVPMYNIENYIKKCIESLINQTYDNCEIIIVNDGSSDNSLNIVNTLAEKDKRIKIINQKNSGVSMARNIGLKNATGEYVVFVDGDDYLSLEFIEYMLGIIKKNDCDFAFSIENYKKQGELQTERPYTKIISSDEACAILLSPKVTVGCWNKIYKMDFLRNNEILFDNKLFYGEGLQFIIECAKKSKKTCIGNKKVYYYRKNNETSATTKFSIDKVYNGEKSLKLIENKINMNDDFVKAMFILHLATFYMAAIIRLKEKKMCKLYENDYKRWKKYIEKNYIYILTNKYVTTYRKTMLCCGLVAPRLLSILDKFRRHLIYRKSVT